MLFFIFRGRLLFVQFDSQFGSEISGGDRARYGVVVRAVAMMASRQHRRLLLYAGAAGWGRKLDE
jgi:hypothetical protein